jgi:hypothetical protein
MEYASAVFARASFLPGDFPGSSGRHIFGSVVPEIMNMEHPTHVIDEPADHQCLGEISRLPCPSGSQFHVDAVAHNLIPSLVG